MKKEKKYKIRMNCSSFHDVIVMATTKKEAKEKAFDQSRCPQNGMEFGEFLEVEDGDEIDY